MVPVVRAAILSISRVWKQQLVSVLTFSLTWGSGFFGVTFSDHLSFTEVRGILAFLLGLITLREFPLLLRLASGVELQVSSRMQQ